MRAIEHYINYCVTVTFYELSAIVINLIHLLENYYSRSIPLARSGNKLQCVVHGTLQIELNKFY